MHVSVSSRPTSTTSTTTTTTTTISATAQQNLLQNNDILPLNHSQPSSSIAYIILVSTANSIAASTDHPVYIRLHGDLATSQLIPLDNTPNINNTNSTSQSQLQPIAINNSTERFPISSVREFLCTDIDVGNILRITLKHAADNDETAAWKPEKIAVQHGVLHRTWTFICPRWLSNQYGNSIDLEPAGDVAIGRRASRRASKRISTGKDDTTSMTSLHSPLPTTSMQSNSSSSINNNSSSSSSSNDDDNANNNNLTSRRISNARSDLSADFGATNRYSRTNFEAMRERFSTDVDTLSKSNSLNGAPVSNGTEAGTKRVFFQLQKFTQTSAIMYLTGSIPALGSWHPEHACIMTQYCGSDGSWRGEWRLEIEIDDDFDEIEYRYMIVTHSGTEQSRKATLTEPSRVLKLSSAGQQVSSYGDSRTAEGGRIHLRDNFHVSKDGLPIAASPFKIHGHEDNNIIHTPNGNARLRGVQIPTRPGISSSYGVPRDLNDTLESSSADPVSSESSMSNRKLRRPVSAEESSPPHADNDDHHEMEVDANAHDSTAIGQKHRYWKRNVHSSVQDGMNGTQDCISHHSSGSREHHSRDQQQQSDDEMSSESSSSHMHRDTNSRQLSGQSRYPNGRPSGSTPEECSPISSENLVEDEERLVGDDMSFMSREELKRLREDRDAMQADRNRIITDRDALKLELDDIRMELEATVRERDSWQGQVQTIRRTSSASIAAAQADNNRSSHRSFAIDEDTRQNIAKLQSQVETTTKERDEAVQQLELTRKQLEESAEKTDSGAPELEILMVERDDAKYETRRMKEEHDALLVEKDQLIEQQNALHEEMRQVEEAAEEKLRNVSDLEATHENLVQELDELRAEVVSKQEEIETQAFNLENMLAEKEALHQDQLQEKEKEYEELYDRWAKEFRERRKLFNTVQELRGNIRVFCRVRPPKVSSSDKMAVSFPDESLDEHGRIQLGGKPFEFDRVFQPASSQQDVYDETSGVVASVIDGYNVCVFAYGQTGSGKTHTMNGTEEDRGVNYRALENLFDIADERQSHANVSISVSMLEIYNENLRDLILPEEQTTNPPKLDIRKDGSAGSSSYAVHVPNLTEIEVDNFEQVWEVMRYGSENRSKGRTDMNEHSSRSHLIVRVAVYCENIESGTRTRGVLHLVDLAGSERVSRSNASGDRLKEAQHINKSLSSLGDVFAALTKNQGGHIPYRNSKLTYLLQDSLGGDSKTLMFVNVSSDDSDGSETLSSLQFAQRVSKVELGNAKKHAERGPDPRALQEKEVENAELSGRIQGLHRELQRRDECIAEMRERNKGLKGEVCELKDQVEQVTAKENSKREGNVRELREVKAAKERDAAELKNIKSRLVELERSKDEEIRRLNSLIKSREQEIAKLSVQKSSEDHVQRLQAQLYALEKELRELRSNNSGNNNIKKPVEKASVSGNTVATGTPASIPGPSMLGRPVSVPSGIGRNPVQNQQQLQPKADRSTPQIGRQTPAPRRTGRVHRTSSSLPGTSVIKSRHVRFENDLERSASEVVDNSDTQSADGLLPDPTRNSIDLPSTANKTPTSSASTTKRNGSKVTMLHPPRRAKDVATPVRPLGGARNGMLRSQNGGTGVGTGRKPSYAFGARTNATANLNTSAATTTTTTNTTTPATESSNSGNVNGVAEKRNGTSNATPGPGRQSRLSRLPRSQTTMLRPPQRARPTTVGTNNENGNSNGSMRSGTAPSRIGGGASSTINGKMPLRRAGTLTNVGRSNGLNSDKSSTTDRN